MNSIKEALINDFGDEVYSEIWPMASFIIAQLKSAINDGLDYFSLEAQFENYEMRGEYKDGRITFTVRAGWVVREYDLTGVINDRIHT